MSCFGREKGMALVVVMAMIVITSGIALSILYFITKQTEISGLQKRYQTAKEASVGAIEVLTKEIIPDIISGSSPTVALPSLEINDCFREKLTTATDDWSSSCCVGTTDVTTSADLEFTLKSSSGQPFKVYTKITDTIAGNSHTGGLALEGVGSTEAGSGIISVQHFPYMHTIEVQGQRENSPGERASFEVLYAY